MVTKRNPKTVSKAKAKLDPMRSAFEATLPEMMALEPGEIVPSNLDLGTVAGLVLSRLDTLESMRAEFETLPGDVIESLDSLWRLSQAALHVDSTNAVAEVRDEVVRLMAEARPLRKTLRLSAAMLANVDLIDGEVLANLSPGRGHAEVRRDLIALAEAHRARWEEVKDRTVINDADIDRAKVVGSDLQTALMASRTIPVERTSMRARVRYLLQQAWHEVRKAVLFLAEDEADEIAPSLFSTRTARPVAATPEATESIGTTEERRLSVVPDGPAEPADRAEAVLSPEPATTPEPVKAPVEAADDAEDDDAEPIAC